MDVPWSAPDGGLSDALAGGAATPVGKLQRVGADRDGHLERAMEGAAYAAPDRSGTGQSVVTTAGDRSSR